MKNITILIFLIFILFYTAPTASAQSAVWKDGDKVGRQAISGGTITVDGTVTVSGRLVISGDVTVTGGGTLLRHPQFPAAVKMIQVENGGRLTLKDVTVDGNNTTAEAPAITVNSGGTLVMEDGAVVMNFTRVSTDDGVVGGVVVLSAAAGFTMNGGEIKNNTALSHGGGVYVGSASTFTMNGGKITGNRVTSDNANGGGGIFSLGTVTINGGEISGNRADGGSHTAGGGIYNTAWGTLIVNGGKIVGNSAGRGQGVFHRDSPTSDERLMIGAGANIIDSVYLSGKGSYAVSKEAGAEPAPKPVTSVDTVPPAVSIVDTIPPAVSVVDTTTTVAVPVVDTTAMAAVSVDTTITAVSSVDTITTAAVPVDTTITAVPSVDTITTAAVPSVDTTTKAAPVTAKPPRAQQYFLSLRPEFLLVFGERANAGLTAEAGLFSEGGLLLSADIGGGPHHYGGGVSIGYAFPIFGDVRSAAGGSGGYYSVALPFNLTSQDGKEVLSREYGQSTAFCGVFWKVVWRYIDVTNRVLFGSKSGITRYDEVTDAITREDGFSAVYSIGIGYTITRERGK